VGESAAVLANLRVEVTAPPDCGVKSTSKEARWPALRVSGSVIPLMLNCELPRLAAETVTLPPAAVMVAVFVSVLPTVTEPKLRVAGETVS
jgi:hypothetical protein